MIPFPSNSTTELVDNALKDTPYVVKVVLKTEDGSVITKHDDLTLEVKNVSNDSLRQYTEYEQKDDAFFFTIEPETEIPDEDYPVRYELRVTAPDISDGLSPLEIEVTLPVSDAEPKNPLSEEKSEFTLPEEEIVLEDVNASVTETIVAKLLREDGQTATGITDVIITDNENVTINAEDNGERGYSFPITYRKAGTYTYVISSVSEDFKTTQELKVVVKVKGAAPTDPVVTELPKGFRKLNTTIDLSKITPPTKEYIAQAIETYGRDKVYLDVGYIFRSDLITLIEVSEGRFGSQEGIFKDFPGYPDIAWGRSYRNFMINEKIKDSFFGVCFDKDFNFYTMEDVSLSFETLQTHLGVQLYEATGQSITTNDDSQQSYDVVFDNDGRLISKKFDFSTREDIVTYLDDGSEVPEGTFTTDIALNRLEYYLKDGYLEQDQYVLKDSKGRGYLVTGVETQGMDGPTYDFTLTPEAKAATPLWYEDSYASVGVIKDSGPTTNNAVAVLSGKHELINYYPSLLDVPADTPHPSYVDAKTVFMSVVPEWDDNGTIWLEGMDNWQSPQIRAHEPGWFHNPEWEGQAVLYNGTLINFGDEGSLDRALPMLDKELGLVSFRKSDIYFYNDVYSFGGVKGRGADGELIVDASLPASPWNMYNPQFNYRRDEEDNIVQELISVSFKSKDSSTWVDKDDPSYVPFDFENSGIPLSSFWGFAPATIVKTSDLPNYITRDGEVIEYGQPNYRLNSQIMILDPEVPWHFDKEGRGFGGHDRWHKDGTYYKPAPGADMDKIDGDVGSDEPNPERYEFNPDYYVSIKKGEEGYVPFPHDDLFIAEDPDGFLEYKMTRVPPLIVGEANNPWDQPPSIIYGLPGSSLPKTWDHKGGVWGWDMDGNPRRGSRETVTNLEWDKYGTKWDGGVGNYDNAVTNAFRGDWFPNPEWKEGQGVLSNGEFYSPELENTNHDLLIFFPDKGYVPLGTPDTVIYDKVLTFGGLSGYDKDGRPVYNGPEQSDFIGYFGKDSYKPSGSDKWIKRGDEGFEELPGFDEYMPLGEIPVYGGFIKLGKGSFAPARLMPDGTLIKHGQPNYRIPEYVKYDWVGSILHGFDESGVGYTDIDFWSESGIHYRAKRAVRASELRANSRWKGALEPSGERIVYSGNSYIKTEPGNSNYAKFPHMDKFIAVDADGLYVWQPEMVPDTIVDGKPVKYGMPNSELPATWDHKGGVWGFDESGKPKTGDRWGEQKFAWDEMGNYYPDGLEGTKIEVQTKGWIHPLFEKDNNIVAFRKDGKVIRDVNDLPEYEGKNYGEAGWLISDDYLVLDPYFGGFDVDGDGFKIDNKYRDTLKRDYWLVDGTYAKYISDPGKPIVGRHELIGKDEPGYLPLTEDIIVSQPLGVTVTDNWSVPSFYDREKGIPVWYGRNGWQLSQGCVSINKVIGFDENDLPIKEGEEIEYVTEYITNKTKAKTTGLDAIRIDVDVRRPGTNKSMEWFNQGELKAIEKINEDGSYKLKDPDGWMVKNTIPLPDNPDNRPVFHYFNNKPMKERLVYVNEDRELISKTFIEVEYEGADNSDRDIMLLQPAKLEINLENGVVWYGKKDGVKYNNTAVLKIIDGYGEEITEVLDLTLNGDDYYATKNEKGEVTFDITPYTYGQPGEEEIYTLTVSSLSRNNQEIEGTYKQRTYNDSTIVISVMDSIYIGHNDNSTFVFARRITTADWGFSILPSPPLIDTKDVSYYDKDNITFQETDLINGSLRVYKLGVGEDIITEHFEDARLELTFVDLVNNKPGKFSEKHTIMVLKRDLSSLFEDGTLFKPDDVEVRVYQEEDGWNNENVIWTGEERQTPIKFFIKLPNGEYKPLDNKYRPYLLPIEKNKPLDHRYKYNQYTSVVDSARTDVEATDRVYVCTAVGISTNITDIVGRYYNKYGPIIRFEHDKSFDSEITVKNTQFTLRLFKADEKEPNGEGYSNHLTDVKISHVDGIKIIPSSPMPLRWDQQYRGGYNGLVTIPPRLENGVSKMRVTSELADYDEVIEVAIVNKWRHQEDDYAYDRATLLVDRNECMYSLVGDDPFYTETVNFTIAYFRKSGEQYEPKTQESPKMVGVYGIKATDITTEKRKELGIEGDMNFYYKHTPNVGDTEKSGPTLDGVHRWLIGPRYEGGSGSGEVPVNYVRYRPYQVDTENSTLEFNYNPFDYAQGDLILTANLVSINDKEKRVTGIKDFVLLAKDNKERTVLIKTTFIGDADVGIYKWKLTPKDVGGLYVSLSSKTGAFENMRAFTLVKNSEPTSPIDKAKTNVSYPNDEVYDFGGEPSDIVLNIMLEDGTLFKNAMGSKLYLSPRAGSYDSDPIDSKHNSAGSAKWRSDLMDPPYFIKVENEELGLLFEDLEVSFREGVRTPTGDFSQDKAYLELNKNQIAANGADVAILDVKLFDPEYPDLGVADPTNIKLVSPDGMEPNCNYTVVQNGDYGRILITSTWTGQEELTISRNGKVLKEKVKIRYTKPLTYRTPTNYSEHIHISNRFPKLKEGGSTTIEITAFLSHYNNNEVEVGNSGGFDNLPSTKLDDISLVDEKYASGVEIKPLGEVGVGTYKWEVTFTEATLSELVITAPSVGYESDHFAVKSQLSTETDPGVFAEDKFDLYLVDTDSEKVGGYHSAWKLQTEKVIKTTDTISSAEGANFKIVLYDKDDPETPLGDLDNIWFTTKDGSDPITSIRLAPGPNPGEFMGKCETDHKYTEELYIRSKYSTMKIPLVFNWDAEDYNKPYLDNCDVEIADEDLNIHIKATGEWRGVLRAKITLRNKRGALVSNVGTGGNWTFLDRFKFEYIAGTSTIRYDDDEEIRDPLAYTSKVTYTELEKGVYLMEQNCSIPGQYKVINEDVKSASRLPDKKYTITNDRAEADKGKYVNVVSYLNQYPQHQPHIDWDKGDKGFTYDYDLFKDTGVIRVWLQVKEYPKTYYEDFADVPNMHLLEPDGLVALGDKVQSITYVESESDLENGIYAYDVLPFYDDVDALPSMETWALGFKHSPVRYDSEKYQTNPKYNPDPEKASKHFSEITSFESEYDYERGLVRYSFNVQLKDHKELPYIPSNFGEFKFDLLKRVDGKDWNLKIVEQKFNDDSKTLEFKTNWVSYIVQEIPIKEASNKNDPTLVRSPLPIMNSTMENKITYYNEDIVGGSIEKPHYYLKGGSDTESVARETAKAGYVAADNKITIPKVAITMNADGVFDPFTLQSTRFAPVAVSTFNNTYYYNFYEMSRETFRRNNVVPIFVPLDEKYKDAVDFTYTYDVKTDLFTVRLNVLKPDVVKDQTVTYGIKMRSSSIWNQYSNYIVITFYDNGANVKPTYVETDVLPSSITIKNATNHSDNPYFPAGTGVKINGSISMYTNGKLNGDKTRIDITGRSVRDENYEFGRTDIDLEIINSNKLTEIDRIKHEYTGSVEEDLYGVHWEAKPTFDKGWVKARFKGDAPNILIEDFALPLNSSRAADATAAGLIDNDGFIVELSKNFILADGVDSLRMKVRVGLGYDPSVPYLPRAYLYESERTANYVLIGNPEYGVWEYEVTSTKEGTDKIIAPISQHERNTPNPVAPRTYMRNEEGELEEVPALLTFGSASDLNTASQHTTTFEVKPDVMKIEGFDPAVSIVTLNIRNSRGEDLPNYGKPLLEFKDSPNKPTVKELGEVSPAKWQWEVSFDKAYDDFATLRTHDSKFITKEAKFVVTDNRGEEDDRLGRFDQDTLTIKTDKPSIESDGLETATVTVMAFRLHEPTIPMVTKQPVSLVAESFTIGTTEFIGMTEPGKYVFKVLSEEEGEEKLHFKTPHATSTNGVIEQYIKTEAPGEIFSCPGKDNCIASLLTRKFAKPGTVAPLPPDVILEDPGTLNSNCKLARAIYTFHKEAGTFEKLKEEDK